MAEEREIEQLELKAGDKSLSLKSVSLNTIITICIAIGMVYIGTLITNHIAQGDRVVTVLEKIESRARVANCLAGFPEAEKAVKTDWCRRFAE